MGPQQQRFGGIRQIGYVVRDIQAAMERWLALGVGPWFYREECPVTEFRYYGRPSRFPRLSIALANAGDLQIELIQQRDDAPSLYADFLRTAGEGAQHVAYWTTDSFDAWRQDLLASGLVEGHAGRIGSQGRFAYFVDRAMPGTVIEISETSGGKAERFAQIREAARTWEGADPIRTAAAPR
jgi:catechol 2,3-dioxygenase-like lactoylglutathione lyase family enzyme